jgi:DNA-binding MarR family transcriptional regulator
MQVSNMPVNQATVAEEFVAPAQAQMNIIPQLLLEMQLETSKGREVIPMAALCKRLNVRMSTLQRYLTLLESHGLVTVHCDEAGRWTTQLVLSAFELEDSQAA